MPVGLRVSYQIATLAHLSPPCLPWSLRPCVAVCESESGPPRSSCLSQPVPTCLSVGVFRLSLLLNSPSPSLSPQVTASLLELFSLPTPPCPFPAEWAELGVGIETERCPVTCPDPWLPVPSPSPCPAHCSPPAPCSAAFLPLPDRFPLSHGPHLASELSLSHVPSPPQFWESPCTTPAWPSSLSTSGPCSSRKPRASV